MRRALRPLMLVAVAMLVALPLSAVAGKPAKTAFQIRITAEGSCGGPHIGTFHASGAIAASGSATVLELSDSPYTGAFYVVLDAAEGSLCVVVRLNEAGTAWTTFEIVGGTGAYAGLAGSGAPSVKITWLYPKGTSGKDKRHGDGCGLESCWCLAPANGLRVDIQLEGTLASG